MAEKRSKEHRVNLAMDPLEYYLVDIATPYWKKICSNKKQRSLQGLIRESSVRMAIELLKNEGIYDKVVENWKMEQLGESLLADKKQGMLVAVGEDELP